MMRRTVFLILAATAPSIIPAVAALASKSFTEILPLKAAMLTKNWQGLLMDVDQKVGIVPELGSTSVGIQRFGPELKRRTLCARQFERCYEATFAMATADKSPDPQKVRSAIPLLSVDGEARGPRCKTFACLTMPATIAVVEQREEDEWSVLMLIVNPTERSIDAIAAAERTMLQQLCALMTSEYGSASVRILDKARETLAGDDEALGLRVVSAEEDGNASADGDDSAATTWYQCEV